MIRYLLIFFSIIFVTNTNANNKDEIIKNLKKTKNLNFQFEQNVNGKIENGNCTIEYPRKIFCEYSKSNNKILVSNGSSIVIKTRTSYYRYPIEKTALNFILSKDLIINNINNLKERIIDNSYINYTIDNKDTEINIFFDKNTFNLIGWQTKDMYQNFNITFLSEIRVNQKINKNLFELPKNN